MSPRRFHPLSRPLLLILLLGGLAYFYTKDVSPPDTSDLTFSPLKVPDDENFALLLLKLASELRDQPVLDSFLPSPQSKNHQIDRLNLIEQFIDLHLDSPTLNPALAQSLLPALQPWVTAHRQLLTSSTQGQFPTWAYDQHPGARHLRLIPRHLSLAAAALLALDRPDEAAEIVLELLETGRRLRLSRGTLNDYLTGIMIQNHASSLTLRLAPHPRLSTQSAHLLVQAFSPSQAELLEGYIHALHHDHATLHTYLASLDRRGLASFTSHDFEQAPRFIRILTHPVLLPLSVKPNQILHDYADFIRRHKPILPGLLLFPDPSPEVSWTTFLPSNLAGRITLQRLVWMCSDSLPNVVPRALVLQDAMRTYVALHQYRRLHGSFPTDLDPLVPHLLPETPREPIRKIPLIYDPVRGILASPEADLDQPRRSYNRIFAHPLLLPLLPETVTAPD